MEARVDVTIASNQELLAGYEAWQCARGFSEATIRRRRKSLHRLIRHVGLRPLLDVDRATLENWANGTNAGLATRTRHAYLSDVRMFFKWAVRQELLAKNPADHVDPPRLPKSLPRPLSILELRRALDAATDDRRLSRILMLGAYAGLRAGEIGALDGADVWLHAEPPVVVVRSGKGGKDRTVPMHPALVDVLADCPSSGPLFPSPQEHRPGTWQAGDRIVSAWVSQLVSAHFRRCGIAGSCHRLRHTFGTAAARASGGDVVAVAHLMGHASINTTLGYIQLAGGRAAEVTSALYA